MKKAILYSLLAFGAILSVFPFFWMFMSSFKTAAEVSAIPPTLFPESWQFNNYDLAFRLAPFGKYFVNSLIVTASCVAVTGATTILAAFAFARLQFPGRDLLFSLLLSMMMIPFEMLMITNYSTIAALRLNDSIAALILPFTASIFYTFILRNAFLSIPDSLYHAARVDGASNWFYLRKVMIPLSFSSLATILLLNAITCWNSFLWPLLVINTKTNRTLPFGLYVFITEAGVRYEQLMAGATIVVLPVILLFLMVRKKIVTGVARGGLKG